MQACIAHVVVGLGSVTEKVRNSGLGPDPDQSAKNGPELGTRSGFGLGIPCYD